MDIISKIAHDVWKESSKISLLSYEFNKNGRASIWPPTVICEIHEAIHSNPIDFKTTRYKN